MKPPVHFYLVILLSITSLSAVAQFSKVVVFAPKGEKFTLFIGNSIQNDEPASRVEAENPGGPSFKIRVAFPDPSIREISKLTFNKPGSTMFFKVSKNPKGVYVLESTTSEWTEDSNPAEVDNSSATVSKAPSTVKNDSKPEETIKNEPTKPVKTTGCDNPVSDADFTAQLIDISARPFESMQLSAAKKMAETHCLLVSHVILVIQVFDSESSRISFAKFAYDHTYNKEDYADVKDALHTQTSKNDLDRYISGKTN